MYKPLSAMSRHELISEVIEEQQRSADIASELTAERERTDALSAHVEWAKRLVQSLTPHAAFALQGQQFEKLTPDAELFLKSSPQAPLAQHNARVAAEVLSDFRNKVQTAALSNCWGTDSDAYEVDRMLADEIAAGGGHA